MILIKEEFVGSEKYRRAMKLGGADAIAMWLAMKCYASKYPKTQGFVPDENIDDLVGAPKRPRKALQALLACGNLLPNGDRGDGLVEAVQGGWQLHDYDDHAVSPEELELRREKARLKKQQQRAAQRQQLEELRTVRDAIAGIACPGDVSPGQAGDKWGHVPRDTPPESRGDAAGDPPGTSLAGARPPAPACPRVPNPLLPTPPHPNFKTPDPDCPDPRASARELGVIAPEHRRFAAEHGIDLELVVKQLAEDTEFSQDPRSATPAGQRHALTKRLMNAAAEQERLGGAA
jgi:hypothetical protein